MYISSRTVKSLLQGQWIQCKVFKTVNTFSVTTQLYNPYGSTPGVGQDEAFVNNMHRAKELKEITISAKPR